ncbi:MAG: ABC transporter ATP-binding protein [Gammaproteobacteria bacterium]
MTGTASARARIEVSELTKVYGGGRGAEVPAVERVSFTVNEGEFVALIGPSGCGKSTILNMVAGLLPRTAGEIRIDGAAIEPGVTPDRVGYVFQRDTVFPWRSVKRNIGYGLELAHTPKAEREREVARIVDRAGLAGFDNAFPLTLSGGMRQRVSLMRTLIMRPEILLMDEPFGALDTHTKLDMHRLLLEIWEEEHQTVIFVTHDLGEALTLSDKIVVLSARPGRIKEIFEVPFARPRDAVALRESAQYSGLFSEVWHSLGEEFRKTRAQG